MTKFRATPSRQSDESTTILAGRCREMQSSECVSWLQGTPRGNQGTIDIIYRNLVLPRRKSSARSRRIVSALAYPRRMVRTSGHRVETLVSRQKRSRFVSFTGKNNLMG